MMYYASNGKLTFILREHKHEAERDAELWNLENESQLPQVGMAMVCIAPRPLSTLVDYYPQSAM